MIRYWKWMLLLIAIAGCGKSGDFTKIKKGEKSFEMLKRFGTPADKKKIAGAEWWLYNDPGKHVLIIDGDTVVNVLTQEQAMRIMQETLRMADSLHLK